MNRLTRSASFAWTAVFTLFAFAIAVLAPEVAYADPGSAAAAAMSGAGALASLGGAAATSRALRALFAQRTAAATEWRALLDASAGRDMTDAEQAQSDGYKAKLASLNQRIEAEQTLVAAERDAGLQVDANAHISGGEPAVKADPRRGFQSFGDFARSVRAAASPNGQRDQRLYAAAPTTFGNEGTGADGGFLIPPEFSSEIWRLSLGEDSLIPMTQNTEVMGNSMAFPRDETTPWGSEGVQAYWRSEAAIIAQSKPNFGTSILRLEELTVLVPVTNELLEDARAIGSYLPPLASEKILWKANEAILFGTGAGQPKGALSATNGALITVAKESAQAADTINNANLAKMVSRLKAGELMNAIWIGNPDILPVLEGMTVGNYPIYLPNNNVSGASYGMLKGRPLMMSEHANTLGDVSDLSLLSLKGYRTITKAGGIETATSMHLYFDANATAFRFIFRLAGEPIPTRPIPAPAGKNSQTRSYFVTLAERA